MLDILVFIFLALALLGLLGLYIVASVMYIMNFFNVDIDTIKNDDSPVIRAAGRVISWIKKLEDKKNG